MKKTAIRVMLFLLLALMLSLSAAAEENSEEARVRELFDAFRDSIPDEVADILPAGFFDADFAEVAAGVKEGSGLSAVLAVVEHYSGLAIRQNLALLARIVGLLVLAAVFHIFASGKGSSAALGRAVSLCSVLILALLLFVPGRESFVEITTYFDTVRGFFMTLVPLMGVLYAMGGNVSAAVANHTVLSAFLSILGTLASGTVMSVAGLCLALALLDAVAGGISLRPLAGLIKRTYTWVFSLLMLLLCGVLGLQSTLAKGADTLALRTVRFAAGSFLPVVGGSVSETLRTVAGSVEYLRTVVGMGGVLVLFFSFLPMFLSVLFTRLAFLLGSVAAKLLSCDAEEKLLSEFASVYGYFLAVIASLFVLAVFALTLFAHCAAAGG